MHGLPCTRQTIQAGTTDRLIHFQLQRYSKELLSSVQNLLLTAEKGSCSAVLTVRPFIYKLIDLRPVYAELAVLTVTFITGVCLMQVYGTIILAPLLRLLH